MSVTISTSISQRLDQVIKALGMNANRFALTLGTNRAEKIYKILRGESKPSFETIEEILKAYPQINSNWLIRGEGQMLLGSNGEVDVKIDGPYYEMEFITLPLLAASALGGIFENCTPDMNNGSIEHYKVLKVEGVSYKHAFVVSIDGNSMEPRYPAGSKVIARPVADGNWQYALGVHAISLKTNMFLIKRILKNEGNILHLVSDNEMHGSLQVSIADINCMWKVGETVYMPAE